MTAPAAADADAASVAALLEALNDPAALIDAATRVVAANAAWRALLPAARLGQPLALALRAPDVLDAIARVQQGGGARDGGVERTTPLHPRSRGSRRAHSPARPTAAPSC